MKKTIAAVLIMLFALAACGGGGNSSYENSGVGAIAGDIRSFANWGANLCATEDTVYFICGDLADQQLRYMDKATGIGGPLCGKPECQHNDIDCNAYLNGWVCGLTIYDGRLYWVEDDSSLAKMPIYSVALDGTGRRIVREMDRDIIGSSKKCSLIQIHDGVLYWAYSPSRLENGESKAYIRMVAFPLDSDEKGYVIMDEENKLSGQYFQPNGDNIYIAFVNAPEWPDMTEFEYILYRWDIKTKQLEKLYTGAAPTDNIIGLWPEEDGLVILGYNYSTYHKESETGWKVIKYGFETGEFEIQYEDISIESASAAIADGLFVKIWEKETNEFVLLVRDFEGNIVLNETIPGVKSQNVNFGFSFRGFDDDYFYFYTVMPERIIVIPRDGSELRYIWTDAE